MVPRDAGSVGAGAGGTGGGANSGAGPSRTGRPEQPTAATTRVVATILPNEQRVDGRITRATITHTRHWGKRPGLTPPKANPPWFARDGRSCFDAPHASFVGAPRTRRNARRIPG